MVAKKNSKTVKDASKANPKVKFNPKVKADAKKVVDKKVIDKKIVDKKVVDIKVSKPAVKSAKSVKAKPKPTKVEHGHLVSVHYVGTLKSGEEFDNSKNHGPIQFVAGSGQVIKGFDNGVMGMKIGETKKLNIPKHEAYGDSNPELVQKIPLSKIPDHIKSQLKVGGFLVMQSPTGQQVPTKIIKLDKDTVSLDMNHPLAGQDLNFEIKLVDINHAPEKGECGCGGEGCGDDCGDGGCGDSCECGHDHK